MPETAMNVTQKLISDHLLEGEMKPGEEIGLKIDQTLTQDATGTLVMLEIEAMELDRVKTELSAQYVDHNLIQEDNKNPDDHLFLLTATQRFGLWYSRAGNGVSHPVHQERFGIPGKTLLGSDSHTPAAGAIGMLAMGAGGIEVAMAMAGFPFYVKTPEVWGVRLEGELPDWVSAKDVILEMLRRHTVEGATGRVIEYYGPGLESLSCMDRHVLANMGTELGATSTVFPADDEVRRFLRSQGREDDFRELLADEGAEYDHHETIDLSKVEPMIALPSNPDNVKKVSEVAGEDVYQCYVGSSANPGYRDFAIVAEIIKGHVTPADVSLDVNPSSRQILRNLVEDGHLGSFISAGARIHQAGCNGCIGMGQAPAMHEISLRTVPRNFPGRSGTKEDKVCLVSPETAAASALTGKITDPRTLEASHGISYPKVKEPENPIIVTDLLEEPPGPDEARLVKIRKGPNIVSLPEFDPLPETLEVPVILKVGDDVSTDEIMPAGSRILPFRSNVPEISRFVFEVVDDTFPERAAKTRDEGQGCAVVGGTNYGQGSSREHAAIAPRYLGLRVVLAKSYARIHWQNLVSYGILPLEIEDDAYEALSQGETIRIEDLHEQVRSGEPIEVELKDAGKTLQAVQTLSDRQVDILLEGGLIRWTKQRT